MNYSIHTQVYIQWILPSELFDWWPSIWNAPENLQQSVNKEELNFISYISYLQLITQTLNSHSLE